mmetsp:Transcript_41284/g.36628  ORF Transcript_41284/g.36628 Transcript_41284/m.36628 type:complete len:133 (+) Transcript_41284:898-1296(+)|eukprot:CAMPEP_0114576146 /NCGR_PEP_ID=MMETSP0125-20121206/934_1 /TAXON_ID=485358 ORGANISM="Aristerostoma sp., Strain ATCC 50986" /NCGR_SAMPLE_ID=MMETSP0125 /ASSEMBLY_ACC=CAM_ASM_000245 /LENGTH=132 /DNA_ID=CAMNT_0001764421 /DNA_START=806 /DNA_END=1204 /DNA_ORIENTATION=+
MSLTNHYDKPSKKGGEKSPLYQPETPPPFFGSAFNSIPETPNNYSSSNNQTFYNLQPPTQSGQNISHGNNESAFTMNQSFVKRSSEYVLNDSSNLKKIKTSRSGEEDPNLGEGGDDDVGPLPGLSRASSNLS